mmetsp:Transcript_115634/g.332085  ORF Transcript_115634/g.332085 Transcript_115634/m.332085 type:complete len:215 (-) Transcript_115634:62-706(-)
MTDTSLCGPVYNICDVIFAAGALSGSLVAWIAYGHAGLVAAMSVVVTICALLDCLEIWRAAHPRSAPKDLSSLPRGPKLPVLWHIGFLVADGLALFCQLICGWTVLCGMVLAFAFGGSNVVLHLGYYSGSVTQNMRTLLPTLTVVAVALAMVLTAPVHGLGYRIVGLGSRMGSILYLVSASVLGAAFAQASLYYLGVSPKGAPLLPAAGCRTGP